MYQHKRWFNLPRECIANAGQLVAHSIADFNFHKAAQKTRDILPRRDLCIYCFQTNLFYTARRAQRYIDIRRLGHFGPRAVCKSLQKRLRREHLYLDRVPPNGNSFASTRRRSQSLQTTYFDRHNLSVGRKMGAKSHASDLEFIIGIADVRFAQPMQIRLPNTSSG